MSYQPQPELGPEAGGWLHEPGWAAEVQAGNSSWRDEDLDLESFVSGHLPHEIRQKLPITPMAEDIQIASSRQPPLFITGRSVDATATRQSSSELKIPIGNATWLQSFQCEPPSASPTNIQPLSNLGPSKLPQEYFPTISSRPPSLINPGMDLSEQTTKSRNSEISHEDDAILEKHSFGPAIQKNDVEDQSSAWKEVRELRESILALRSLVHQKRVSLKELGRIKAEAENLLFSRMMMVGNGVHLEEYSLPGLRQKSLQELMDDCQDARNRYGPEEDDCIILEEKLSRLEFNLNRLEQPFFLHEAEPHPPLLPPSAVREDLTNKRTQGHDSDNNSSFDDEFEEPHYHPLVSRFLSKLGDLDLLQERYDNHSGEKRSLEQEKLSRARFGMSLNPDDQAWLDDSQDEFDNLLRDIDLLEKEVADLRKDCLALGLVDADDEPTNLQDLEEASFHGEEDLNAEDQTSEYVKYPTLLPLHPGQRNEDVDFYEPELESDEMPEVPTTRINKWILESLRKSPLDVYLLASTFEITCGRPSGQWEILVLQFWHKDCTTEKTSGARRAHASSLVTETDISNPGKRDYHSTESPFSSFFS